MNHRIVGSLICACLAVAGVADAQQRREGPGRQRFGNGSIVGRVFDASTNTPIRRAQIQGTNDELFVDAVSDEEGRFQLTDLPAGRWRVTVAKGGYFTWQPGQKRPFEPPAPITLASGQRVSANVPMSRGGVITGRVSDDTGEPLAGLRVRVYRARMAKGYRRLEDVGAADYTDDTGAYRIFGLPPGDYYVAASLRMAPLDSVVQTTYSPTYYPGTGELAEAQRIRVELGSESTAIFPLLPIRHVTVTGSVLTSSGAPASAFLESRIRVVRVGYSTGHRRRHAAGWNVHDSGCPTRTLHAQGVAARRRPNRDRQRAADRVHR